MSSLLRDFAKAVDAHPNRVAIVDGKGRETTFAQLKTRADGFAAAWRRKGIRAGDRVLLAMPVDADLYAALAALWSLGVTVVLPEPAMGIAGLRHAAKVTKVSAFCSAGIYGVLKYALPEMWFATHLRAHAQSGTFQLPTPQDDDIALVSFTSGTSGAPKAIPRSHGFLGAQQAAIAPMLDSDQTERDLVTFPVFVLINIAAGRTSILPNWKMSRLAKLAPEHLCDWITSQHATRALLPPSLCEKLNEVPVGLTRIFTGGGPVFPHVLDRLTDAKQDLKVTAVYGSTEAEPIAHLDARTITESDRTAMLSGSGLLVGKPVDVVDVRIVSDEIQVAGDHVNAGYLDPAHDAENKIKEGNTVWHRTGDAGTFDDEGRLWLWGRVGTTVMIDGTPTYPFAIEVAAQQWNGVQRSALVTHLDAAALVIAGDPKNENDWKQKARDLGIKQVIHVMQMPMDKRHASKVDRKALAELIS